MRNIFSQIENIRLYFGSAILWWVQSIHVSRGWMLCSRLHTSSNSPRFSLVTRWCGNLAHCTKYPQDDGCDTTMLILPSGWHLYTFTTWIAVDTTRNCRLQSWTLHKSADCRWISITILYVSFTNSATVRRLEQVQLCNRLIDQSADNITGLKCAKECLILKYKYIQNPWYYLYCLHIRATYI